MIRDLMDKLHIQDNVDENVVAQPQATAQPTPAQAQTSPQPSPAPVSPQPTPTQPIPQPAPAEPKQEEAPQPPMQEKRSLPPLPKPRSNFDEITLHRGGDIMNDGIIIDLGDGISLNVPIKKRMTLHEFLRVAEKVKALEMLADEEYHKRGY